MIGYPSNCSTSNATSISRQQGRRPATSWWDQACSLSSVTVIVAQSVGGSRLSPIGYRLTCHAQTCDKHVVDNLGGCRSLGIGAPLCPLQFLMCREDSEKQNARMLAHTLYTVMEKTAKVHLSELVTSDG